MVEGILLCPEPIILKVDITTQVKPGFTRNKAKIHVQDIYYYLSEQPLSKLEEYLLALTQQTLRSDAFSSLRVFFNSSS